MILKFPYHLDMATTWPDTAAFLRWEHTKRVWTVGAMSGTPAGDVGRVVILWISDDGNVLEYKRQWEGLR